MPRVREKVNFYPHRRSDGEGGAGKIARGMIPPGVMAARQNQSRLAFSSMMSGHDDDGQGHRLPETVEGEAAVLFRHIREFMDAAGGTPADLVQITLYVMDDAYRAAAEEQVVKMFPDPAARPAYHILNVAPSGLRNERVQAVIAASVRS